MKHHSRYSGLFSDMPGSGWITLIASLACFCTHAVLYRKVASTIPEQPAWMLWLYVGTLLAAFIFAIWFGYIAWRTTEKRRKEVDRTLGLRDASHFTDDYRN